jgi:HD superfamily phosphohydrolase
MPSALASAVPELAALGTAVGGIRIPPGVTVPLSPRVKSLIDSTAFRRLAGISQLGLVALVYPGARHSRFEHSLGVYRLAIEFLFRLQHDARFQNIVGPNDASAFLAAALLHDLGHWAFCHPLEDMGLPELPKHESLLPALVAEGEIADILRFRWGLDPARVAAFVTGSASDPAARVLQSLLSGPIDVDKMDYLARDSIHAGVPYGNHFDQERLLSSLCLDESGLALAITDKGCTAAELLVVARSVMFSEVYWHHAVRAATAMLQRAIWLLRELIVPEELMRFDDADFITWATAAAHGGPAAPLVSGLFGPRRQLHKRVAMFDPRHHPTIHAAIAGRHYSELVEISRRLTELASPQLGQPIDPDTLLIDAPPAEREIEFRLQVREHHPEGKGASTWSWVPLADRSPLVRSLAQEQFDDVVKRVRIFAPSELAESLSACPGLEELVLEAASG